MWLATEPLNMRSGTETALARMVSVFGAARPHHAYLFASRRVTCPSVRSTFPRQIQREISKNQT
jgi:hypothetical protein